MAELKEIFEMVTNRAEPDLDAWQGQERRQRRAARGRKVGAVAVVLVTAVGLAAVWLNQHAPATTARTVTSEGPTPTAKVEASSVAGSAFPNGPAPGRSTTQTPTPVEETAAWNPSAGTHGGGLTTTVMPYANVVARGG